MKLWHFIITVYLNSIVNAKAELLQKHPKQIQRDNNGKVDSKQKERLEKER